MATYKRLILVQKYLIQSLHHQQKTQQDMTQQVGVSQVTISLELAKHQQQSKQPYDAQQAQQRAGETHKWTPYKLKGSAPRNDLPHWPLGL